MGPTARFSRRASGQRGVTLVELLVSMVIGLVVMIALSIMYVSGGAATRHIQAQAQMDEDAEMALSVLGYELRNAGFNPERAGGKRNDLLQKGWSVFACDTGFVKSSEVQIDALACNPRTGTFTIALAYEGDLNSGKNTSAGLPRDCIGSGITPVLPGNYYVMQSRLYVANGALRCSGGGDLSQSQVLAENIESMTMEFGVTDPAAADSQSVAGYLSAGSINTPTDPALDALAVLSLQARWAKAVSARVCVIVVSETAAVQDMRSASAVAGPSYRDCQGSVVRITDGKMRRAYRTTITLRNQGVGYSNV